MFNVQKMDVQTSAILGELGGQGLLTVAMVFLIFVGFGIWGTRALFSRRESSERSEAWENAWLWPIGLIISFLVAWAVAAFESLAMVLGAVVLITLLGVFLFFWCKDLVARRRLKVSALPLDRNRSVHRRISYQARDGRWIELPFVIGVLADLSGHPSDPLSAVEARQFEDIDIDTFDDKVKAARARIAFRAPDHLAGEGELYVEIAFDRLDDFSPMNVARKVGPIKELLTARNALESRLAKIPVATSEATRSAEHRGGPLQGTGRPSELTAANAIHKLVIELEEWVRAQDPAKSPAEIVTAVVKEIDRRLSDQLNFIIHHEDFCRLESTWRGLHRLVKETKPNRALKIRVLNLARAEFEEYGERRREKSELMENPIYRKICREPWEKKGGEPFGCLVGDYYLDHTYNNVHVLELMGSIALETNAPFISAISPKLLGLNSWAELNGREGVPQDFYSETRIGWHSLRQDSCSSGLVLTLPCLLGRSPFRDCNSGEFDFNFNESVREQGTLYVLWINPAFEVGIKIAKAFRSGEWSLPAIGGEKDLIENLPTLTYEGTEGIRIVVPTGTFMGYDTSEQTQQLANMLAGLGLSPLCFDPRRKEAFFFKILTLDQTTRRSRFDHHQITNLPELLTLNRFVHYLKYISRDRLESSSSAEVIESVLNAWLSAYTLLDPGTAPFAEAKVLINPSTAGSPVHEVVLSYRPPVTENPIRICFTLP